MIKKLSLLALLLLLIGGIGIAVTYSSQNKEVTISDKKQIENDNITTIQIDVDSTDVEFIPVRSMDEARVELVGTGVENTLNDFSVKEDGETLSISLQQKNKKWFSFNFYFPELKLKIFAPEKMYNSVNIKGFSSDIYVPNLQAKMMKIATDNGDVKVENITSEKMTVKTFSGEVHMEHVQGVIETRTDNGDVTVLDAPVKSFDAQTFSGEIKLENVMGELTTITDNGDINISTSDIIHSINGKTFSGDIKIESDNEPTDFTFDVGTISGDVNLFGKYNNNAKMGTGTVMIQLETDSGDITATKK